MLGDEDRMTAERRLLSVVGRCGGREPLVDEIARVLEHGRETLLVEIGALPRPETEAAPEGRPREPRKDTIHVLYVHRG